MTVNLGQISTTAALGTPHLNKRSRRSAARRIIHVVIQWTIVWGLVYAAWQWLLAPNVSSLYLVGPDQTLAQIGHWINDGSLWSMVELTMGESLIGLGIGTVGAILLVTIAASSRLIGDVVEPVVSFIYAMPKFVFAPILFVWLGGGFRTITVFVIINTFPIVFVNTMIGVRTIDPERVQMMRLLGANRTQISLKLLLPHTFGFLCTSLISAANHSITAAVGAEIIFGATVGLGGTLYLASEYFNSQEALAVLLVATIISALYMKLFQALADANTRRRQGRP